MDWHRKKSNICSSNDNDDCADGDGDGNSDDDNDNNEDNEDNNNEDNNNEDNNNNNNNNNNEDEDNDEDSDDSMASPQKAGQDPIKHARMVIRCLHSSDQRKEEFKIHIITRNQNGWFKGTGSSVIKVPKLEPLRDVKT